MLAFACAMFVGVSCTPDTPEDPNNGGNGGNEPVYTVTILAEASAESLAAEGGQFEVSYTLTSDELLTDVLTATSSASWLTASVAEGDEQKVCVEYTANPSVAEARQATLTLSYPGAKDVVLSYTQNHGVPAFNVTWEDATPKTVYAYIESLNDPNMTWMAFVGAVEEGQQPEEYFTSQLQSWTQGGMGMDAGIYKNFLQAQIYQSQNGYTSANNSATPVYCVDNASAHWNEKSYLVVVGLANVPQSLIGFDYLDFMMNGDEAAWENWFAMEDTTTFATVVHAFKLGTAPAPAVSFENTNVTLPYAADCAQLTYAVENPVYGGELSVATESNWVEAGVVGGKLHLLYEANPYAVTREAEVEVSYAYSVDVTVKDVWSGIEETMPQQYVETATLKVTQEANPTVAAVKVNVEVTGTQFNGIWVNVTCSDPEATYALNTEYPDTDNETGAEIAKDWNKVAANLLSYVGTATFYKGSGAHFIKTNPTNYNWFGKDYYVYAVAVDATSEETTDYYGNPKTNWTVNQIISDVAYDRTTIDDSAMPTLTWDKEKSQGLVWNESENRYDLEAVEGSTVVLYYTVTNPVEGGVVTLNGTSLYDYYNVVDGEPVIDEEACSVTFKIDAYDTKKSYHYVSPTFKYTNAEGDNWGVTSESLRITQTQAPAADEPATPVE